MLGICCALSIVIGANLGEAKGLQCKSSSGLPHKGPNKDKLKVIVIWYPVEAKNGEQGYMIRVVIVHNFEKKIRVGDVFMLGKNEKGTRIWSLSPLLRGRSKSELVPPPPNWPIYLDGTKNAWKPAKVSQVVVRFTAKGYRYRYTNKVSDEKVDKGAQKFVEKFFPNDKPDKIRCRVWVEPDFLGWNPTISPDTFSLDPDSVATIDFSYYVPGDAIFGNRFVFSWENITYAETTHTEHIAYLKTNIPGDYEIDGSDTLKYQWVEAGGGIYVYPGAKLTIDNTFIEMMTDYSSFFADMGSELNLKNFTIEPDSGKTFFFNGGGILRMENTAIVNPTSVLIGAGLGKGSKQAGNIVIDGLAVSNSQGDGISFFGCVADTLHGIIVDSAGWNGIWFVASKCTLYSCWINGSANYDLLVSDTSDIYMLSCYFDTGKVQIETGSKLTCAWLFSMEAIDHDSIYPDSSEISIFDVDSNLVYNERIEGGALGPAPLIQYKQTEYGKDFSTPHLVVFSGHWSWGDWDTTFTINVSKDTFVTVQSIGPAPTVPTLLEPSDGTITNNNTPTFNWSDVPDATRYHLQVANDTLFESPLIDDSTLTESAYTAAALADGLYFWRVRAAKSYLWSDWSPTWNLMIDTESPTFESTTVWTDTSFGGPYTVTSIVSDYHAGVDSVFLYYRVAPDTVWSSVQMESIGDCNLYSAEIPEVDTVATIDYYLWAIDYATNTATDPEGAPTTFYSFERLGIAEAVKTVPAAFALLLSAPNPFSQSTIIGYQLPVGSRVSLKIYS
ncbi:MAG TPA: right-handed parallel beta-helix repeat-containing protein, partial [bacterium (Candidatus Stahlbacteria)]|nr:right-handed parallel beta-helix repeat-containing protein [Candidatus Stahlbacteria bacterium]